MNRETSITIVRAYLAACEARRLDDAERFLAPGAELIFPGGRYRSVAEMVAAARGRYRWARKASEEWDVDMRGDGTVVVVTTGRIAVLSDQDDDSWMYDYRFLEAVR